MSGFLKKFSENEYSSFKTTGNNEGNKIFEGNVEEHQVGEHSEIGDVYEDISFDIVEDKSDTQEDLREGVAETQSRIEQEAIEPIVSEVPNMMPVTMDEHHVETTKSTSTIDKGKNKHIFQTSNTKDEKLIRDDEKIKKRRITIIISIIVVTVLCIAGFFLYKQANKISVPSFALEKELNDVEIWAAKNKIELDSVSKYSIKADEGMIISQSKKSGSSIQKGDTFKVVVSKGADQSQKIKVPDFSKMKLIEIESWKEKNKASNVTIEKVFSEDVASGDFISMAFKTDGIDASNYRRKDKIIVVVSKGKEVFEKNIVVPDFKNKSKGEVDTWASEKEVKVEYSEAASSTIMEGNVISQDVEAKTKIAKNDTVKIVVSKGKVSIVPNFAGLNETQATIEASKSNVAINSIKYYNNQVPAGQLISQSLPAGTETNSDSVVLVFSSGKPYIANFDGQDLYALVQSINEMNTQGANIGYQIQEVSSSEPKGSIITTSVKADFVNIGASITITVSRGS